MASLERMRRAPNAPLVASIATFLEREPFELQVQLTLYKPLYKRPFNALQTAVERIWRIQTAYKLLSSEYGTAPNAPLVASIANFLEREPFELQVLLTLYKPLCKWFVTLFKPLSSEYGTYAPLTDCYRADMTHTNRLQTAVERIWHSTERTPGRLDRHLPRARALRISGAPSRPKVIYHPVYKYPKTMRLLTFCRKATPDRVEAPHGFSIV